MITYASRENLFAKLSPFWDLFVRLFMAHIFWRSGLTKIDDWDATLFLFKQEYGITLFPTLAAYASTGIELVAPVMLVVGFGSRLAAFSLLILSIIIHMTYPQFNEHYLWMLLCAGIVLKGPGRIALDHCLCKR